MNDNKAQYTSNYMLGFDLGRQLILENTNPVGTEVIELNKARGRVVAKQLLSSVNIPHFDNSAMDGYAVNFADLQAASKESPVTLKLVGLTAAGDGYAKHENSLGRAWKIMTGAAVPEGFDSIIPVENTYLENDRLICFTQVNKGDHIRRSGEDFTVGEVIAKVGRIIDANTIMACAALGISHIEVYKSVDIAVFSTGKELVDDPESQLLPGQIRNSNKPFILEWLKYLPVNAFDAGTNYDDVEKFSQDLKTQLDKNTPIIISSGAVSMGDFDFIPQAIINLGGEIVFHKAKIRPGKPILFARFSNGSLYFGLPGNPISAAIGLRFFVSTCIRRLLDLPVEKAIIVSSTNEYSKKSGFRSILKAKLNYNQDAKLSALILDGQESFKIKPLLHANGWLLIDETKDQINAGDLTEFYPSSMSWE